MDPNLFVATEIQSMRNVLLAVGNQKQNMQNFSSEWLHILSFFFWEAALMHQLFFCYFPQRHILLTCRFAENHSFNISSLSSAVATGSRTYTNALSKHTDLLFVFEMFKAAGNWWGFSLQQPQPHYFIVIMINLQSELPACLCNW